MNYNNFLKSKVSVGANEGFDPVFMPDMAFDFQRHIIDWAVRKGRGAILADCGLGKTLQELAWAQNVVQKTNGNVLIVTVLSVAHQIVTEAEKFGIEARRSSDGTAHRGITVTNYEQIHKFNPNDFVGVACDESSILKNFDGTRKTEITAFMRKMPYRLLASATPAPNDFTELGTSSECLGYMGYVDMLNKFFKNNLNNSARGRMQGEVIKWRFKGHAEGPFWDWVSGWSIACRRPSDLGYANDKYTLPELITNEHIVKSSLRKPGDLFHLPAVGLQEQRTERKNTVNERCEKAAELIINRNDFSVAWCHTNQEGDLLEQLIPDSVQISGKDSDAAKERKFNSFVNGEVKHIVTKPSIGAWGLNFQHCNHMTFFPSHSFEQYYQSVRRFWRFGQLRPVHVDIVATEGERGVLNNLQRKESDAANMFDQLVGNMGKTSQSVNLTNFETKLEVPSWL
jgi:hypothetical protein